MICGSGGSKSRRVRSQLARWEMSSCAPLWREAPLQVKKLKTPQVRNTFLEAGMSKKCAPLWHEAHFEVKMYKTPHARATFGRWSVVLRGRCKGLCTLSRVSKTCGFCSISKNDGRHGTFEEDLERCIFPGRRSARGMFIRAVRRSGHRFPERGCILEHQIFSLGKIILRDRCSTWAGITFSWRAQCFRQVEWKNCKTHWYEAVSVARNFPFLKEVSQNCFVSDGVKFEKWRSLAELFRF